MSDGPSKAYPGAEPLDDIILTDDDNTVADAAPPVQVQLKPSSPPPLGVNRPPSVAPAAHTSAPPPPSPSAPPPVSPSGAPSSGGLKAAKRAKMTLRIPDDEIARPLPQTPVGGFAAAPAPVGYSPDDTIELPPGQMAAHMAAIGDSLGSPDVAAGAAPAAMPFVAAKPAVGINPANERGWTPYQPEVNGDEVDDQATTGHHPAALQPRAANGGYSSENQAIAPVSEEIPVEMDLSDVPPTQSDEVATSPRLPSASDSEEIRIEEGLERPNVTMGETGEVEIAAEDLMSVESLPAPSLKTAGKYPAFKGEEAAALNPGTASALIAGAPLQTVTPVMGIPAVTTPSQGAIAARRQPVSQPSIGQLAPPPMTDLAASRKKIRPWWEELFNDDFIRTMAKVTDHQIGAEVTFIEESLGCEAGAMILDLACGTGRHAVELAARGYQVVGFDLSLAMLARASDEAQDRKQKINFVQGDMREMTFEETFDGVYSWNTSFGYFDEEKNSAVISRVHKSLKKGGQFLLDVVNRDNLVRSAPSLAWFEGDGCICMDEMTVDFITSRMKVKRTLMMDDGRTKEIEYSIRVYALHELGKMLHDNGFRVAEVSGRTGTPGVFFGCESPRTLILAEKR